MTDGERLASVETKLEVLAANQREILRTVKEIQMTAARWKGGIFAVLGLGGVMLTLVRLWDSFVTKVG